MSWSIIDVMFMDGVYPIILRVIIFTMVSIMFISFFSSEYWRCNNDNIEPYKIVYLIDNIVTSYDMGCIDEEEAIDRIINKLDVNDVNRCNLDEVKNVLNCYYNSGLDCSLVVERIENMMSRL